MLFRKTAAALLGLALLLTPALALGPEPGPVYDGIDVSIYQGDIDFARVRDSGVEVVYIRAGEGSDYVDPYFEQNARGAREAGLRFGFYLYVTARSEAQAREQAAFFADLIRDKGGDCRPAMDFENFSGLTHSQVNAIGLAFLGELEARTGVTPVLYTDAYAADAVWDAALGAYPLWAANYGVAEPDVTSGHWRGWSGFQYADDGTVPGIPGRVDLDRFTEGVFLEGGGESWRTYTVRPGDTLWAISRRFGTTVEAIVQANDIQDPNLIYVGQTLRIPAAGDVTYTVRSGDTLWAISRRFGTTVEAIAQANGIADPNLIYVGQVLSIP